MLKYLSKILKQKKFIIFTFLFLCVLGMLSPQYAHAGFWCNVARGVGPTAGALCDITSHPEIAGPAAKAIGNVTVAPFFSAIILAVSTLLITIFGSLSNLAGRLLIYIMDPTNINGSGAWSYTSFTNPIIAIGWTKIRDLANMVVVLGFIVIGIATALRFETYKATKLLPKLIIAALLINFSLLICGIFIDGSNIIMTNFLKGGGFLERSVGQAIDTQVTAIWNNTHFFNINGLPNLIGATISLVFFDIITLVIFFLYFFLFLCRYIFLWILVALSPLAFVFYVFPFTKKFFDMWWNNFLQWCIIGISGAFFIYLADQLTTGLTSGSSNAAMIDYLVPSIFLIGGLLFSIKSSAIGSSMAISAFKWSGKNGLKGLAGATGLSRVGGGAKNMYGRTLERLNLRSEGSTGRMRDKDREEIAKNVETLTEDRKTQLATGRDKTRYTKEGADKREAAIRDKIKNNNLGDLGDSNAQHQALAFLESREKSRGIGKAGELSTARASAAKNNPLLAGMDDAYVARESAKSVAGGGPALTKQDVNYGQLKKSWKDMSLSARSKFNFADASILSNTQAEEFALAHASDVAEATRAATDPTVKTANTTFLQAMVGAAGVLTPNRQIDDAISAARVAGDVATDRDLSKAKRIIKTL